MVAVRITAPRAARTVGLVWMGDRPQAAPVAAFRDFALGYRGRLLTRGDDPLPPGGDPPADLRLGPCAAPHPG